ncbi:hypothetical protein GCM10022245_66830 [Streptomyces mayteni]
MFQANTHKAAARQPLAEQTTVSGAGSGITGSIHLPHKSHGNFWRGMREKATPGSHGGSRPASVRRSDGGCGAPLKYDMQCPDHRSRTAQ